MKALARIALFLALLYAAPVHSQPLNPSDPQALSRYAESVSQFGFRLLATFSKRLGAKPENRFISPISVVWALDMVLNGADGPTYAAMAETLQVAGWNLADVNAAALGLRRSLESADPKVQIFVANSLWGKAGLQFLPGFLDAAKKYFTAELAALSTADPINAWVSAATQGKIPSIVRNEDITPQSILFLVNALYFKGLWQRPFDKAQTQPSPFHRGDGTTAEVPTMNQRGRYAYYEDREVQAIRLPYGNGRIALIVALPAASSSLKAFVDTLDPARWKAIVGKLAQRPGSIALPRFKVEFGVELVDALELVGMHLAFTDQADFKKMAQVPPGWWIKISSVRHKTFVEVNEEGTEAAAATVVSMMAGAAPPPPEPPFTMKVDRPFFAALQDSSTGAILFFGTVVAP